MNTFFHNVDTLSKQMKYFFATYISTFLFCLTLFNIFFIEVSIEIFIVTSLLILSLLDFIEPSKTVLFFIFSFYFFVELVGTDPT